MDKQKLFVDFDNTITNSTKAFCEIYNYIYEYHKNFVKARWEYVNEWDFKDECPLLKDDENMIQDIFASDAFFENLEFLNESTYEALRKLSERYEVILVTIGTFENIALKTQWIAENLPFIKECIFIVNNGCKMDKSTINMHGGIFLEDHYSNLKSSNASTKICVGKTYSWNEKWDGIRCETWDDIITLLLQ